MNFKNNRNVFHQPRLRMPIEQTAEPRSDVLAIVKGTVGIEHSRRKAGTNGKAQEKEEPHIHGRGINLHITGEEATTHEQKEADY